MSGRNIIKWMGCECSAPVLTRSGALSVALIDNLTYWGPTCVSCETRRFYERTDTHSLQHRKRLIMQVSFLLFWSAMRMQSRRHLEESPVLRSALPPTTSAAMSANKRVHFLYLTGPALQKFCSHKA